MRSIPILLLALSVVYPVRAFGQGPPPVTKSPPDTFAPEIPGVVAGGTRVRLIRDLFQSTVGRGAVYKIAMLAQGVLERAK